MKYLVTLKSEKLSILQNYIYFFKCLEKNLNIKLTVFWKPSDNHIFSLLKSPHVNKKAKEHYSCKTFSCLLIFDNFSNFSLLNHVLKNKPNGLICKIIING